MNKEFVKLTLLRIIWITLGTLIAAFSLECVLIPNDVIDGGIVGISIMANYLTKYPLGLFLIVLNLPFVVMAFQKFGKMFVFLMFYGLITLALFSEAFLHTKYVFTNDTLLAALFGGMILGMGVGIVLKSNASLDGTEIMAMKLAQKQPFSVGEIIMFFNIFIFTVAGFVYGPDKAMYSAITYFIAYRLIDIVLQGLNEAKSIFIISSKYNEIGKEIMKILDKSVTYLNAEGGYSGAKSKMIYCVITKIEIQKTKDIVNSIDPSAFIAIENVHEVDGKRYRKKK
ncbi:TPA: YitT family protein [Candidatus Galligastranaerophilus intestinigallinarum]|nr:YitT family protein [Candidatus Galligastranaerophilus intestinigallinarum]